MPAILTRHLGSGCNDFLNEDLSARMKRLTGTRSNGSPCQDTGPDEVSPSSSPDPSPPMNNAGEPPVAILMAGVCVCL